MINQAIDMCKEFMHRIFEDVRDNQADVNKAAGDWINFRRLREFLPYDSYEESTGIFINSNSLGFTFELNPLMGAGEKTHKQLERLFKNELPKGYNVQFCLYGSPKIGNILDKWQAGESSQFVKSRREFFEAKAFAQDTSFGAVFRNFRLIISFSTEIKKYKSVEREETKKLMRSLQRTFETMGMVVKLWRPDDLISFVHEILNFELETKVVRRKWNRIASISEGMVSQDNLLQVEKDGLVLDEGKKEIRSYHIDGYPDESRYMQQMLDLIGSDDFLQINCPFLMHYCVHILPGNKRGRIEAKASNAKKMEDSKFLKHLPHYGREIAECEYTRKLLKENHRAVSSHFQVVLLNDARFIEDSEHTLINIFDNQELRLRSDKYIMLPMVLNALPMSMGSGFYKTSVHFNVAKTTMSQEPANFVPVMGEWKGTDRTGMLFVGRRGQVMNFHPRAKVTNYNISIVGTSGGGKSVLMNEIARTVWSQGGCVYVLDVGRSFKKICKLMGGEFISFEKGLNICINPFTTIPDDAQEFDEARAMLKSIVATMARPVTGTNELEESYIESAIKQAWENKRQEATISDVADILLKHEDKVGRDVGHLLYPYTKEGEHGKYFNGRSNINLDNRLIVVEFEELQKKKNLCSVVLQVLSSMITDKVYLGDRSKFNALIIDEGWSFLDTKIAADFIKQAAKRMRKYESGLITATQNTSDFTSSLAAMSAFNNSSWKFRLQTPSDEIEMLGESIVKNDGIREMWKSVEKTDRYSEVLIENNSAYTVGRLFLDKFSLMLYNSEGYTFDFIEQQIKDGKSMEEAIQLGIERFEI